MHDRTACEIEHAHGGEEAAAPPQCAIGTFTNSNHAAANTRNAEKRMRSATDPATSATVIIAKVIWYSMNNASGIVFASGLTPSNVMPWRNSRSEQPTTVRFQEGKPVPEHNPQHRNKRRRGEALRHGGEDVFLAHHTGIKQCQARNRHHQDNAGCDDHPGSVGGVDLRRLCERRRVESDDCRESKCAEAQRRDAKSCVPRNSKCLSRTRAHFGQPPGFQNLNKGFAENAECGGSSARLHRIRNCRIVD